MIGRVLRSARRRTRAAVARLQQRVVAARARRAVAALPPEGDGPSRPESQEDELLARLGRVLGLDHLARFALQADSEAGYAALARRQDPEAAVALAVAMQQHGHPGRGGAIDAAVALGRRVPRAGRLALVRLLLLEGRGEEAARLLDELGPSGWEAERLLGDVVNPFAGVRPASLAEWEALAARIYRGSGVEPFRLGPPAGGAPFDRLTASAAPGSVAGPLVSVVMTSFQPGAEALVSARSILAQSWRELELLVMDDASGPDYDAVLDELAALDPRVRVVRAAENAGTYVRRNEALRLARGEFVTMQDSDDWSHPRRLELQARHLQAHPALPANLVVALRVTPALQFVQRRGLHLRLCEPAVMIRREEVLGRIGFFDSTRRSADSEFRTRIAQVWGADPPVLRPRTPLVLMRSEAASLSGGDFGDGWTHPSRFAYRSASLQWQRHELAAGRTPFVPFPLESRPFPAPPRIEGRPEPERRFPVVVVGDGRGDALLDATPHILAALDAAGEGAAFLAVPSFRSPEAMLLSRELQQRINEGRLAELCLGDEAEAELVVLAHPDAALGLPRGRGAIRARRVVVLVAPDEAGFDGRGYAAGLVDEACRAFFGVAPDWAPSLPRLR